MNRIVMKFGGTSVGTAASVAQVIEHVRNVEPPPLVVVSAVGGVTDLLIAAGDAAVEGEDFNELVEEIVRRQNRIISDHGLGPSLLVDRLDELQSLLKGMSLLRERSPRVHDMLVSLGERMSVRIVAAALQRKGVPAQAFDAWELGMITTPDHGRAKPTPTTSARILKAVDDVSDDTVIVTTGFIGRCEAGEVTTFGRGGSDYSAALFGASIGASEIQIWTDVPGILRADPRVVDAPSVVPSCRFEEAAELAFFGAKVLHPRTIEPAQQAGVPVRVLSTFDIDPERPVSAQGTLINDEAPIEPVRAIALQKDVESLELYSLGMLETHGYLARVFSILAEHEISVDVVATSEVSVSMTFDPGSGNLDAAKSALSELAEVKHAEKRSLLCLVGAGMKDNPDTRASIFAVLARERIPVHVISQGASRINTTLVMDPEHALRAMKLLHDELLRG